MTARRQNGGALDVDTNLVDDPTLSEADYESALRITPLFYDAVLQPGRWETALKAMTEWFAAPFASMHLQTAAGQFEHYLWFGYGFTEAAKEDYLAYGNYGPEVDPRPRRYFPRHVNKPVHCRQIVTESEWHRSPMYQDLFKPYGLEFSLLVTIVSEDLGTMFSVGVYRGPDDPPFTQTDVDRFQLLMPHLRRAADVYGRLVSSEIKSRQLENAFDDLALATLFTNTTGEILFANRSATELLDSEDGICRSNGRASHSEPETATALAQAIRKVAAETRQEDGGKVLQLTLARRDSPPILATICSLAAGSPDAGPWLSSQLRVAVFLTDPQKSYETTTEHLQRIFGLTQAEAKIARDLAAGLTLREIAGKRGRALETVRQQLKSVMSKTGARRQAELVKSVLALGIPLEK